MMNYKKKRKGEGKEEWERKGRGSGRGRGGPRRIEGGRTHCLDVTSLNLHYRKLIIVLSDWNFPLKK